jgi:thioredoxin-dependent peroxiredoxin
MISAEEDCMQKKLRYIGAAAVLLLAGLSTQASAQTMPKVGDMAPDFTLSYFDGNDLKPVSLSQYRGKKNVVVAFFVFAFTGG